MKLRMLLAGGVAAFISLPAISAQEAEIDYGNSGGVAPTGPLPVQTLDISSVLYDNGPFVNSPGTGDGGADESVLQASLGMNTLGFGHQFSAGSAGNRIADDFTVTGAPWKLSDIVFYAYQTNAGSVASTITSVNLRIWDGMPDDTPDDTGSVVIWGNTTDDVMTNTAWSGVYRVTDTTDTATNRAIMAQTVGMNDLLLQPGTYWLDWQTAGSAFYSGPWAPPITITGQTTTGDALQRTTAWAAVEDDGTGTLQGFPFIINGVQQAELSVDDVSLNEGTSGTTDFIFTVSRNHTDSDLSVDWAVADGVAKNGAAASAFDNDYSPLVLGGMVNFVTGGVLTKTITIPVNGDTRYETDEDFKILLSNPVNAVIIKDTGVGTIANDDTPIACAVPSNLLLNCSFEEPGPGDFTSWLPNDIAVPASPIEVAAAGSGIVFPTHPTDGTYSMLNGFNGAGPGTIELAQEVSISLAATTLEFDYRLGWGISAAPFVDRTFSVQIEPPGGGTPLQTLPVLSTSAVADMPDTGILRAALDISAFAGQTVRINFVWNIPEDDTGPGQAELDNVLIRGTPGVYVTPTSGLETTEDLGSDTFNVVLNTIPSSPVTLSFVSDDSTEGTAAPATATFNASNWNVPQTVTVIGVNDDVMDGDQLYKVVNTITTASPEYPTSMPVDDVSVINLDNNAQLTIKKIATGGNATFEFSSSSTPMLDSASITTVGGIGQQEFFTALEEGTHNLTEDALGGWSQEAANCDNGKSLPDIQLGAGENVTCTFENTKLGSLTVVKNTIGGDGTFSFTSASSIGDFNITTATNTGQQAFTDLTPGTYDVAETVPAGWSMTNSVCSDGSTLPNVGVDAGENVTCTFENTQHAPALTLTKSAAPASFALLGDSIRYLFEAKNEGNVDLTAVTVTDPLSGLGTIDCDGSGGPTVATLAVAGSFSCEAMYTITQADLDAGSVTNKGAVVAKDPSLKDVTAGSNEVIISKLTDVCYDGELTIPDGMVFMGSGSTTYSSTVSIDTEKLATPMGVIVEAPHELILKAPTVEFNKMFDVEGDPDVDNPPAGGQLRVIIGPVTCL